MSDPLLYRSEYLLSIFEKYDIPKDASILEIGSGDDRNVNFLKKVGYINVTGIDKIKGTDIENFPEMKYDVIFTMSTLFTILPKDEWIFEKIAKMTNKYLMTFEGEATRVGIGIIGRNYKEVFTPLGFEEIYHRYGMFNQFGVLRIFKKL